MILPKLTIETTLQTDDLTRIDATYSFASLDEAGITDVEIDAGDGGGFVSVYNDGNSDLWYMDYSYDLDGLVTVQCRVTTTSTPAGKIKTADIVVVSPADDALFSGDDDILALEPDLKRYLPAGKNSYNYTHREAQQRILLYLDSNGIRKNDHSRFEKLELASNEEIRQWSKYQTLLIIFEHLKVSVGDIFEDKKDEYESLLGQARGTALLRLDRNSDAVIDDGEWVQVITKYMGR